MRNDPKNIRRLDLISAPSCINATKRCHAVALFDLDDTILDGDSDVLWFQWLHSNGLIDDGPLRRMEEIYRRYREGSDDAEEFIELQTLGIEGWTAEQLERACRRFFVEELSHRLLPEARRIVQGHRGAGDRAVLLTAVMEPRLVPLVEAWGFDGVLGTTIQMTEGRVSTTIVPPYCFREGKAVKLERYVEEHGIDLTASSFYADSINDLPVLELVGEPRPVDPDPLLLAEAKQRGWTVIRLRGPSASSS